MIAMVVDAEQGRAFQTSHDRFHFPPMPSSSSRDRNVEDTYEAQNDQRLDELHSKIRSLRGVRLKLRSS
jgi:hypothetical protein